MMGIQLPFQQPNFEISDVENELLDFILICLSSVKKFKVFNYNF